MDFEHRPAPASAGAAPLELVQEPAFPRSYEPFRVDVRNEGATVCVSPVGELDLATAPELASRIRASRGDGSRRLLLDLHGLTFMDMAGLWLVLDTYRDADEDGVEFALVAGPAAVQRVFELLGLREELPFGGS